jgi:hypothetical protein
MATIYSYPNPTGFANCAILASQENYYAPFLSNVGNWTQLRVSAYLSYCGASGFQTSPIPETVTTTISSTAWYWGIGNFSSSLGLLTPVSAGCNFMGIATYGLGNTYFQYVGKSEGNSNVTYTLGQLRSPAEVFNGNTMVATLIGEGETAIFFQPYLNTGSGNYCVANTLIFTLFNKGNTGQQIAINNSYDITGTNINSSSFTEINTLRVAATNLLGSGAITNASAVFYYTTGLVATGGPLPLPDTVYLHSPFVNNLLRIHNLVVEKYA